jgi:ferredoxin
MKVIVDQLKCRTAALCVKECPDVFRFQEGSKRAEVRMDEIPLRHQDCCIKAAKLCPNGAIAVKR